LLLKRALTTKKGLEKFTFHASVTSNSVDDQYKAACVGPKIGSMQGADEGRAAGDCRL